MKTVDYVDRGAQMPIMDRVKRPPTWAMLTGAVLLSFSVLVFANLIISSMAIT